MNPLRLIRVSLLMLFALLQCMAPFAHAHINGQNVDEHVYIELTDATWLHHHDTAEVNRLSATGDYSAVVTMQPEHRIKEFVIVLPVFATSKIFSVFIGQCEPLFSIADYQPHPFPPFQHPCSQAPPV